MAKNNKKKKSPATDEQLLNRQKAAFKRKIKNMFTGAGFSFIPTNDHEMYIGHRNVEIDSLFIFENIWLVCEDTVQTTGIKDHIRTKNEAVEEIRNNFADFVNKLAEIFPEHSTLLKNTILIESSYSVYIYL